MVKYKILSLRLPLASIGVIISTEFNTPHELEKKRQFKGGNVTLTYESTTPSPTPPPQTPQYTQVTNRCLNLTLCQT